MVQVLQVLQAHQAHQAHQVVLALPAPVQEAPLVEAPPVFYCSQSTLKSQETSSLQITPLISSYAFTSFLFEKTLLLNGNSRPGPSFSSSICGMYPRPDRIHTYGYPPGAALELDNFSRIKESVKLEIFYIIVDVVLINYSNQHDVTLSFKNWLIFFHLSKTENL
jgi:hypothetical protein